MTAAKSAAAASLFMAAPVHLGLDLTLESTSISLLNRRKRDRAQIGMTAAAIGGSQPICIVHQDQTISD